MNTRTKPMMDLNKEALIVEGKAKRIQGNKKIEGVLFLTNAKIIFDSHKLNIIMNLDIVKSVKLLYSYRILKRGITITKADGEEEQFIIKYAKDWKQIIDCYLEEQ